MFPAPRTLRCTRKKNRDTGARGHNSRNEVPLAPLALPGAVHVRAPDDGSTFGAGVKDRDLDDVVWVESLLLCSPHGPVPRLQNLSGKKRPSLHQEGVWVSGRRWDLGGQILLRFFGGFFPIAMGGLGLAVIFFLIQVFHGVIVVFFACHKLLFFF